MGHHVPVDIGRATGQHRFVDILGKKQLLVPSGKVANLGVRLAVAVGVGPRIYDVLCHPCADAVGGGHGSRMFHVFERSMTISVAAQQVNVLSSFGIVERGRIIIGRVAQGLTTHQLDSRRFVETGTILANQRIKFLRSVVATAVIRMPVGLVLDRHYVDRGPIVAHIAHESVEPREEILVLVAAELADGTVGELAACTVIGLETGGRTPRCGKDDSPILSGTFYGWQEPVPVVGRVPRSGDIANGIGRHLHAKDVEPHLGVGTVELVNDTDIIDGGHRAAHRGRTKSGDGV